MSFLTPTTRRLTMGVAALAFVAPLHAQQAATRPEPVDTVAITRILQEATTRSQVMDIASWMTDVYGSRLTGTPGMKAAGEWARGTLAKWGLANAALEPFTVPGFDRGWTNERFSMQVVAPTHYQVIATPSAWTAGPDGPVTADVVMAVITDTAQLAEWRGKLRGKLVMTTKPFDVEAHWKPEATRLSDEDLGKMAAWAPSEAAGGRPQRDMSQFRAQAAVRNRVAQFLQEEGALGVLTEGRGDGGTIFSNNGGQKDAKQPMSLMQVMVASESYGRMARTLEKGVPVQVSLDVKKAKPCK